MKSHFITLTLQCRKSREVIDLSHQISFFHGKVSSGKSSISRLIDFCLGGELERTPAIIQELLSATLELTFNNNNVLLERDIDGSGQVMVTWIDEHNETATVMAPIKPGTKSIWNDNIYGLSDLLFYLLGLNPYLVPSNNDIDDAKLIRISFRNFMWYCYLDQHHLDSSFYRLEDPIKQRSSREVMKFIMRFSNQKLSDLEAELIRVKDDRSAKTTTAAELRTFLSKFGYSTIDEIEKEIENTENKLFKVEEEKERFDNGYIKETHYADDSRNEIRKISYDIERDEESLIDLEKRISEQESLKAELISTKFKIARTESVTNILSGVKFDNCPQCGSIIKKNRLHTDNCSLCGSDFINEVSNNDNAEIIRRDIDSRINDIEISISNHKTAYNRQKKMLQQKHERKRNLEFSLLKQLEVYESIFLSNVREIDRKVATYKERLKSQNKLKEMPQAITDLEKQCDELISKEHGLKREIELERQKLFSAEKNVEDLEEIFLNTLLTVGLPGISEKDTVKINRKTWEVFVYPDGEEYKKWNFSNAGSGGKRTLFNVCYLLSIHTVASKNKLPIPSFMIIDTPMKNIDKEVNEDLFKRFYDYLYQLAETSLSETQIVLIDNSYCVPPLTSKLSFYDRYMTNDDDDNPPLISYYRGA
ncbi:MAG: hypothetical protein JXA77_13240 [Bacteroidales bacterium]|nr:hypothetical protein [Bacteroidales bacterium]